MSVFIAINIWIAIITYFYINGRSNLIIGALKDMDSNIIKAGNHSIVHGEFHTASLQCVLIALRLYMITNREQAIKTENYESVKYYDNIIKEMEKLIQTTIKFQQT
jgi:hypothetical protein